jgi:hypothetical protein
MEFVLAVLVLALAVVALAYPLYRAQTQPALPNAATLDDLLAERDGVYATLRDMELDRELGKLDERDYAVLHDKYMNRAGVILKELDALRGKGETEQASAEIEREVAALRKGTAGVPEAEARAAEARRKSGGADRPASSVKRQENELRCANCGRPYQAGDKFCARCGHSLT